MNDHEITKWAQPYAFDSIGYLQKIKKNHIGDVLVAWYEKGRHDPSCQLVVPSTPSPRMVYRLYIHPSISEHRPVFMDAFQHMMGAWEREDVSIRLIRTTNHTRVPPSFVPYKTQPCGLATKWLEAGDHDTWFVQVLNEGKTTHLHSIQKAVYNALNYYKRSNPLSDLSFGKNDRMAAVSFYVGGVKGTLTLSYCADGWVMKEKGEKGEWVIQNPNDARKVVNSFFSSISKRNAARNFLQPSSYYFDKHKQGYYFTSLHKKQIHTFLLSTLSNDQVELIYKTKKTTEAEHQMLPLCYHIAGGWYFIVSYKDENVYGTQDESSFFQELKSRCKTLSERQLQIQYDEFLKPLSE